MILWKDLYRIHYCQACRRLNPRLGSEENVTDLHKKRKAEKNTSNLECTVLW